MLERSTAEPRRVAMVAAIIIGIALSALPHLIWFMRTGSPVWIADHDDMANLGTAATALRNQSLFLSDPAKPSGGSTIMPLLPLLPGTLGAGILRLEPIHLNLLWRLWAGLSIALMLYWVIHLYTNSPWIALGGAVLMMTDAGVNSGWMIYQHLALVLRLLSGDDSCFAVNSPLLEQWRVNTPGLKLAYLLLHVGLLRCAVISPTRPRLLWAGLGFGLLFYVYFYYWTAASLALAIAFVMDKANRKSYLFVAVIGLLAALPQLLSQTRLLGGASVEFQQRMDVFMPIPRFTELLWPKMAMLVSGVSIFWVFIRRKDLIHLWALAASGILLTNHQIITGFQIQNAHWCYLWGPFSYLLLILIAAPFLLSQPSRGIPLRAAAVAVVFFTLVTAAWLRTLEAVKIQETFRLTDGYHRYLSQRSDPTARPLAPRGVVGGDEYFIDYAVIMENQRPLTGYNVMLSPDVGNFEWEKRRALNAYLLGHDRDVFLKTQTAEYSGRWGPWARNVRIRMERLENSLNEFDAVIKNPRQALKAFEVNAVALPASAKPPEYLKRGWKQIQTGPAWQLWELDANAQL